MIQVTPELSVAETQALTAARQTADTSEEIKATDHVYIEKNGRYVLHRDVELMNGNHVLLDCQSNGEVWLIWTKHKIVFISEIDERLSSMQASIC